MEPALNGLKGPKKSMPVALIIWLGLMVSGFAIMTRYSLQAAPDSSAPLFWPQTSQWRQTPRKPSLIVFLHPRCGCSSATLDEVESLLPALKDRVQIILSFYHPHSTPLEWGHSRLWDRVQDWPGIEVKEDPDGQESSVFGANTSGEMYFYDPKGKLIFHGGLTPSRGHRGDTLGKQVLLDVLDGKPAIAHSSAIFGCALRESHPFEAAYVR